WSGSTPARERSAAARSAGGRCVWRRTAASCRSTTGRRWGPRSPGGSPGPSRSRRPTAAPGGQFWIGHDEGPAASRGRAWSERHLLGDRELVVEGRHVAPDHETRDVHGAVLTVVGPQDLEDRSAGRDLETPGLWPGRHPGRDLLLDFEHRRQRGEALDGASGPFPSYE